MLKRLVVSCLVCLCAVAGAQQQEDARTVYKNAETQYALGHFNDAAELFEKVFALKPDPVILYDAAQAHRLAGNKQKALVLYQNYLRLFGERKNHEAVERQIHELEASIEADRAAAAAAAANKPEPSSAEPAPTQPPPSVTPPPSAAVVVTEPPPPKKPLVKRGWFWGVVAGSVVVVGAAVALGVVFGRPGSPPGVSLGTVQAN